MNQFYVPFFDKSIRVTYTDKGLTEITFVNKKYQKSFLKDQFAKKADKVLRLYIRGDIQKIDLPIDWQSIEATSFQKNVWKKMIKIPYGKVKTYGELARAAGSPKAFRAVGSVCGKNHLLLIVPCHRVVSSQGLGGFSGGGLPIKRKLHQLEGIEI